MFAFIEGLLQPTHIVILLIIGILLFGNRLPEIGRSLGKGLVEFKKGMKGIEDELETGLRQPASAPPALEPPRPPQRVQTTLPKFEENAGGNTNAPQS